MSSQKGMLLRRHFVAINNSDDIIDLTKRTLVATICRRKKLIFATTNVVANNFVANNVVANNHYCSSAIITIK